MPPSQQEAMKRRRSGGAQKGSQQGLEAQYAAAEPTPPPPHGAQQLCTNQTIVAMVGAMAGATSAAAAPVGSVEHVSAFEVHQTPSVQHDAAMHVQRIGAVARLMPTQADHHPESAVRGSLSPRSPDGAEPAAAAAVERHSGSSGPPLASCRRGGAFRRTGTGLRGCASLEFVQLEQLLSVRERT